MLQTPESRRRPAAIVGDWNSEMNGDSPGKVVGGGGGVEGVSD